jgi:hypothetical protein
LNRNEALAFVAGFLEGEGCIGLYKSVDRRRNKNYTYDRPEIIFVNSKKELLEFCSTIVGGHIYPKRLTAAHYRQHPSHWSKKPLFQLTVCGKANVQKALEELIPFLISNEKRERALRVLERSFPS